MLELIANSVASAATSNTNANCRAQMTTPKRNSSLTYLVLKHRGSACDLRCRRKRGFTSGVAGRHHSGFQRAKAALGKPAPTGIKPRLPGVEIGERIALSSGASAFAMRIPRSWTAPHMVVYAGRSAFYGRTSAGKYQLDVDQIRSAFALSQATKDRIRDFRADRIAQIAAGETPMKLARKPVVVVHVMPLSSFEAENAISVRSNSRRCVRWAG